MQLSQLQEESLKKYSGLCGIQTFDHCNGITNWAIFFIYMYKPAADDHEPT